MNGERITDSRFSALRTASASRDLTRRVDYTKAIELAPNNSIYVFFLGLAKYGKGDFKEAAADLGRSIEMRDYIYTMLFRYLARTRAGETAAAELEANVSRLKTKQWPYAVVEFYLGKRSPAATLDAAKKPDERDPAAIIQGQGDFRIQLHGSGKISDCLAEVTLERVGVAAVVVADGVVRIEFDSLGVVGDRPVEMTLGAEGSAASGVSLGVFRLRLRSGSPGLAPNAIFRADPIEAKPAAIGTETAKMERIAPGHHGYQRACDLFTGQASKRAIRVTSVRRRREDRPPSLRFLSQTSAGSSVVRVSWRCCRARASLAPRAASVCKTSMIGRTVVEGMARTRMPQPVHGDGRIDAGALGRRLHDVADGPLGERLAVAPLGREHRVGGHRTS